MRFDSCQLVGELGADDLPDTFGLHGIQNLLLLTVFLFIGSIKIIEEGVDVVEPLDIKWLLFASNPI